MADADVLYPVKVVEVNLDRKIPGFRERQSMVRVEPQGNLVSMVDPDDPMWIGIKLFSEYITVDDRRVEAERIATEQAARSAASQSFEHAELVVDDEGVTELCFRSHVACPSCCCLLCRFRTVP